jgi:membrane associated rhomboid family serine protease
LNLKELNPMMMIIPQDATGSGLGQATKGFARDFRRWVRTIVLFIVAIWIIGILDMFVFGGRLTTYGILPRAERGLVGILLAPFLHSGIGHLLANSVGILFLGGLVILRSESHFWVVTLIGALASGLGTWLLGRPAYHVGASGTIFAYFGYLVFTGWFERRFGSILLSAVVVFLWGSMIFGVFPVERSVSWEGHLFGLIGGVVAARLLAPQPKTSESDSRYK